MRTHRHQPLQTWWQPEKIKSRSRTPLWSDGMQPLVITSCCHVCRVLYGAYIKHIHHLDQPQAGLVRVCRKESRLQRHARCFIKFVVCQKTERRRDFACAFFFFAGSYRQACELLLPVHVRPAAQNIDPLICMLLQMLREIRIWFRSSVRLSTSFLRQVCLRGGGGGGLHNMIIIAMRGEGDVWLNWYICSKSFKNSCPCFSFEITRIHFFFPLFEFVIDFFFFFKGEGCFGVSRHN